MKSLVILGSTGSIGRQTLEIVRAFPGELCVVGLTAGNNLKLLAQQIEEFTPQVIAYNGIENGRRMTLPSGCQFVKAEEMVVLPQVDLIVAATVGGSSICASMAAIEAGKSIALANKEIIVMAGDLITHAANKYSSTLLPVDSEPSAIWQCLQGEERDIARLLITASGGALRNRSITSLASVTPEEALRHPTWEMGNKITIDSATLMNKAFEVIECRWLFDVPWERIQVVIHPQSIIHSMVEFSDGSVKAQISPPDMRLPIQYALLYPQRKPNESFQHFDPVSTGSLTFESMDLSRYPCFSLALNAAKQGGTYPAVLSAADEVAVRRFLEKQYGFLGIYSVVEQVLSQHISIENPNIEAILAADAWARQQAEQVVIK